MLSTANPPPPWCRWCTASTCRPRAACHCGCTCRGRRCLTAHTLTRWVLAGGVGVGGCCIGCGGLGLGDGLRVWLGGIGWGGAPAGATLGTTTAARVLPSGGTSGRATTLRLAKVHLRSPIQTCALCAASHHTSSACPALPCLPSAVGGGLRARQLCPQDPRPHPLPHPPAVPGGPARTRPHSAAAGRAGGGAAHGGGGASCEVRRGGLVGGWRAALLG